MTELRLLKPQHLVWPALLVGLSAGCHVFQTLQIDCTEGMPCAELRGSDADTDADSDTDTDSDSDTDTDTDTSAVPKPSQGYAVAYTGSGVGHTIVYDADGTEITSWHNYAETTGPVAFDASTQTAFVFHAGGSVTLYEDGTWTEKSSTYPALFDIDAGDGLVWGLFGTDLGIYHQDGSGETSLFDASLIDARGVTVRNGTAYVVDNDGVGGDTRTPGPDLWTCDATGDCERLYMDFDTSTARGRNVFNGPGGEPFACTSAGAVYSIPGLYSGETSPLAFFDSIPLTDVTDCGWDEGSSEYLLYSVTNGVIRMAEDSSGSVVTPTPGGYAGARAHFYEP